MTYDVYISINVRPYAFFQSLSDVIRCPTLAGEISYGQNMSVQDPHFGAGHSSDLPSDLFFYYLWSLWSLSLVLVQVPSIKSVSFDCIDYYCIYHYQLQIHLDPTNLFFLVHNTILMQTFRLVIK